MLNSEGNKLDIDLSIKSDDIQSLSLSIVQSALKTISVTDIVWKEDLKIFHQHALTKKYFPQAKEIEIAAKDSLSMDRSEVHEALGYDSTFINFDSIKSFQINDHNKNLLGYLVEAQWNADEQMGEFMWLFSTYGKILAILPKSIWPSQEIKESFDVVVGRTIAIPSECNTLAEIAASEVYFMSGVHQ